MNIILTKYLTARNMPISDKRSMNGFIFSPHP